MINGEWKIKKYVLSLLLLFCVGIPAKDALATEKIRQESVWFKQDPSDPSQTQLKIYLFLTSTCPHCQKTERFFNQLAVKKNWIVVRRYYINKDKHALDKFNEFIIAQKIKINAFAVPAIFFCDARWLGFDSANNTGKALLRALNHCRLEIIKTGQLTPRLKKSIEQQAVSNWFETSITEHPSLLVLISTLVTMDVLMPSSLFAIWLLIAVLVLTPTRPLRLMVGGSVLLLVGLSHAFQQMQPTLFYQFLTFARWLLLFIGMLLLGMFGLAYKQPALFANLSAKKIMGVAGLMSVAVFGVYSQTRTSVPNFALVFQQYLQQQSLLGATFVAYGLLYQFLYLIEIALLLVIPLWAYTKAVNYQDFLRRLAVLLTLLGLVFLVVYPLVF